MGKTISLWNSDLIYLDKYLKVGLLAHMAVLFLMFWGTSIVFSIVAASIYTDSAFSTSSPTFVISCLFSAAVTPKECVVVSLSLSLISLYVIGISWVSKRRYLGCVRWGLSSNNSLGEGKSNQGEPTFLWSACLVWPKIPFSYLI